jgi:hypothetical protein
MDSSLVLGALRVWRDDKIAIAIAAALALIQVYTYWLVRRRTTAALRREGQRIRDIAERPSDQRAAEFRKAGSDPGSRLRQAWTTALSGVQTEPDADRLSPEEAFDPARLLPRGYNARLDAAAPGLFTALGIIGTFLGLIVGFLRVNPSEAGASVGPLLGGMVVAFVNSLIGVVLSVVWTYRSRVRRHDFDMACDHLASSVSRETPKVGAGELVRRQLAAIAESQERLAERLDARLAAVHSGIGGLRESTETASRQLLENLSDKLGDSFKAMVSMPFDQLNDSVVNFDRVVQQTAARQEEIRSSLQAATVQLTVAQQQMTSTIDAAKQCVEEFAVSAMQLREGATAAGDIVERTRGAAEGLGRVVADVERSAGRYEAAAEGLSLATGTMTSAIASFEGVTQRFESSTRNLEHGIEKIVSASDETVEKSAAAVRRELEESVKLLVTSVGETGQATIDAYEASTNRVVRAVDERMSDLTDRLSAELTTLSSRLPAEVESLNEAMKQIRNQIQQATRSMDNSVKELAQRTPEALRNQLDVYDKALAAAMDHFSGTLLQWDTKLESIGALAKELRRVAEPHKPGSAAPAPLAQ